MQKIDFFIFVTDQIFSTAFKNIAEKNKATCFNLEEEDWEKYFFRFSELAPRNIILKSSFLRTTSGTSFLQKWMDTINDNECSWIVFYQGLEEENFIKNLFSNYQQKCRRVSLPLSTIELEKLIGENLDEDKKN